MSRNTGSCGRLVGLAMGLSLLQGKGEGVSEQFPAESALQESSSRPSRLGSAGQQVLAHALPLALDSPQWSPLGPLVGGQADGQAALGKLQHQPAGGEPGSRPGEDVWSWAPRIVRSWHCPAREGTL